LFYPVAFDLATPFAAHRKKVRFWPAIFWVFEKPISLIIRVTLFTIF